MQFEDYFDFLAPDDIRLKGEHIGIEAILYKYIYHTQTAEEIAESFPHLSLEQIYATILYYLHNRTQVQAYMTEWMEHRQQKQRKAETQPLG